MRTRSSKTGCSSSTTVASFSVHRGRLCWSTPAWAPARTLTWRTVPETSSASLRAQGVGADDVNIVVHTHLHQDHVGWNVDSSGDSNRPYFPRARYLGPRKDWEHFTRPEVLPTAPHVTKNVIPLDDLGLIDFIDDGHNVTDEITTLETPGHTPGHQVILVSSQGEKAAIIGDLIHNPVQIYEPDWCAFVDTSPDDTRRSRKSFMDRAEREDMIVAAGHFHPDRHIGRFVRLEGRRYWQVV